MSWDSILLLVAANGAVIAALVLASWLLSPVSTSASVVAEDNPLGVSGILGVFLQNLIARSVKVGSMEKVQHRLDLAGNPRGWNVERVFASKVGASLSFFVLTALFVNSVLGDLPSPQPADAA